MADEFYLLHLASDLENRATQFEVALRRFAESLSTRQWKVNSSSSVCASAPSSFSLSSSSSSSSSSNQCGVDSDGGRNNSFNDLSSYIPSLQSLLFNLANLRRELVSLHRDHHQHHRCTLQNDGSAATIASAPVVRRRPAPCTNFAANPFLVSVENALTSCDIDFPGMHTTPPPHPTFSAIRQSREVCLSVWNEFYLTRHQPIPVEVQKQLRLPTFNNWPYTDAQLLRFVRYFFTGSDTNACFDDASQCDCAAMLERESEVLVDDRLRLTRRCGIPEEKLDTWLCAVYAKYNCVQFHNFKHAFMVAQMMYASICCADLASLFSHLDLFTLLFAAICHDLDHPGLTNVYQNNIQSRLSACYNTLSPLENHHCAVAFELVRTPITNIFVNFTDKDLDIVRQNTVRCILGTDMAKHTDIMEAFTAKMMEHSIESATVAITSASEMMPTIETGEFNGNASTIAKLANIFDKDEESHALTMVILLKMCDISTEIRPDAVARPWLVGLINELSNQRDLERKNNLPLSPVMDDSNLVQCQLNFLSYAMLPLAKSLISIIPALEPCFLTPTEYQLARYRRMVAERAVPPPSLDKTMTTAMVEDEEKHTNDESVVEGASLVDTSAGMPHIKPADGREGEESNGSFSTSPPLPIPFTTATVALAQQQPQQACISTSTPDREPSGRTLTPYQSHTFTGSSGVGASSSQQYKRTSIVSSAGLIAAELTPPHRPLRRSLGELPWSTHALLLTHIEDAYRLAPPPPPRANRPTPSWGEEEERESDKSPKPPS